MKNILTYKNVNIHRQEKEILTDVSFSVKEGEFVYLTGNVGTGKSSLLKSIYAEISIPTGEAEVVGFDLLKITRKEIPLLRRKLGIIFQDFQLLSDRNIFENLKFVMEAAGIVSKKTIENRIKEMLEKNNLVGKELSMPHELSGGEQQRCMIARAMLNNPELIIADEPTGNLDNESADSFMKLLKSASSYGTAVLMVTHDEEIIKKYPARVIQIKGGKLENKQLKASSI